MSKNHKRTVTSLNSIFEKPEKRSKTEKGLKNRRVQDWGVRDVTCDSVIITRDLAVIRNHTIGKSQGHKIANRAQR